MSSNPQRNNHGCPVPGMAFSPRLVGQHRPDYHSFASILEFPRFKNKSGEALILALYDFFTSPTDGTYHFFAADEAAGRPSIRGYLMDPLKLLNGYGWMLCGQHSHFLYRLYRTAGFQARQIGLPGHSVCEVYDEGRWHFLDIDMWAWFRTPAGHIASAYELAQDPKGLIIDNPSRSNPCNLPDRTLAGYARMFETVKTVDDHVAELWPPWSTQAHTMDFALRPGETLIRSQRNEGRFPYPESWKESIRAHADEWKGQPRERYQPFRTFGNGRWIYEPNLSSQFADFPAGVQSCRGITQAEDGLHGAGQCEFAFRSPYPFVGIPDPSGKNVIHRDGAWLSLCGSGDVKLEISTPTGQWVTVPLAATGRLETVDITDELDARYEVRVRLSLDTGATVSQFKFDSYLMTAPMTLPRLAEGDNPMELKLKDAFGLATIPMEILPDFRNSAAIPIDRQAIEILNGEVQPGAKDWLVIAPKGSAPVQATFRFDAPFGDQFAWYYILGTVGEGPVNGPGKQALLEWSVDGQSFYELTRLDITRSPLQWDCSIDATCRPPTPTPAVFIRVTSDTAIGGLEFHGHLDRQTIPSVRPQITHRWLEMGVEKSFTAPENIDSYTVTCGPNPTDHVIEMRVASARHPCS